MFFPHLSLKYITYFFLSVCSLPDLSLFPACCRVSSSCFPPPLPRRAAIRVPLSSLPSLRLSSAPPACCVFRGCCVSPAVFCCVPFRLPVPVSCSVLSSVCAPEALRRPSACPAVVCRAACRHSSAIRRKTVWQCGQMHRVYVPGCVRVSSCLCAAVCSVARPVACPACCRVSSGGNNRRYASISRAAAMRCSVCNVMLLLSIWIYTFCRVCPIRLASSTMPIPTAVMCSRM